MDIVEFLTARLDEDAAVAKDVRHDDWTDYDGWAELDQDVKAHAWRHDPARVLREVAAKRAIVHMHGSEQVDYINGDGDSRDSVDCKTCDPGGSPNLWPCDTLKYLAAAYADHPDYDQSWRP